MTDNTYQSGTAPTSGQKTRSTRWLIWVGAISLLLALACLVASKVMIAWHFQYIASVEGTPRAADIARGISNASIPMLGVVPFGLLGLLLIVLGFALRRPVK